MPKTFKKNGLIFTATLNRSLTSYIKVVQSIPIGTHDWIIHKTGRIEKLLTQQKLSTLDIKGLKFNPINRKEKIERFIS